MFNARLKRAEKITKEARILLALAKSSDPEIAQVYVQKAMEKLCEIDSEDTKQICTTIDFLSKCVSVDSIKLVMGEDLLSLSNMVGKLKIEIKESPVEDIQLLFYGDEGAKNE